MAACMKRNLKEKTRKKLGKKKRTGERERSGGAGGEGGQKAKAKECCINIIQEYKVRHTRRSSIQQTTQKGEKKKPTTTTRRLNTQAQLCVM